jgi:hypothetical protein
MCCLYNMLFVIIYYILFSGLKGETGPAGAEGA